MAIKFLTGEYCYIVNATWLDGVGSMSVHCRVRFDTVGTGSQFVFRYRNGTSGDQMSLRKDSDASSGKLRFSVTTNAGGQNVQRDTTFNPVAGTIYDFVGTWQRGVGSNAISLYINGVLDSVGTSSSGQTIDLNAAGTLMIGARPATPATEYGQCTIEHLTFYPGVILDANRALALAQGSRVHRIGVPMPAAYYPMYPDQLATIIDQSGNARHIIDGNSGGSPASDVIGGAINDPLRPLQPSWWGDEAFIQAGVTGSGEPEENEWIQWTPDIQEDQTSVVITGLTNGTPYEFKAIFLDDTGNPSADSNVVEATPTVVTSEIITPAPWRRSRYLTKYRSGS